MRRHQVNTINLEGEVWKPVIGYEGLYEVSNLGRVKSCSRSYIRSDGSLITIKNRLMQPNKNIWGYFMCSIWKGGQKKYVPIHRLVATAFIPNPHRKETVNHKNGVRDDNHTSNLEWLTHSEQHLHAYSQLGRINGQQGRTGSKSPRSKGVLQLTKSGMRCIGEYGSIREASRITGVCAQNIGLVIRGRLLSAGGYKWKLNAV